MGCLPDPDRYLRLRSLPRRLARVPHNLRQLLLGPRAAHRYRRRQFDAGPTRRMGVPDSVQSTMDVASPAIHRNYICPRVAVVAG